MRDVGDEELVYRVAEGDERALSELYDRYSRPVYATGIRLLRDVSLAEELLQDVFTNVWRRAGKFDPFTQTTKGNIAQITDASVITEDKVVKNSEPFGITVAPDGNPWYTMFEANKIATLQLR